MSDEVITETVTDEFDEDERSTHVIEAALVRDLATTLHKRVGELARELYLATAGFDDESAYADRLWEDVCALIDTM